MVLALKLCYTSTIVAQNEFSFDHFTVRDGLPDNAVTCIMQDSRGFMWFGTYKGISRFDGYADALGRARAAAEGLGEASQGALSADDQSWPLP
jgi:ligand-binding sensor domain-containing protein